MVICRLIHNYYKLVHFAIYPSVNHSGAHFDLDPSSEHYFEHYSNLH